MIESAPASTPEIDLNPHPDLPAARVISTEISPASGERQDVRPPIPRVESSPLPFGVYCGSGNPAPSETPNP